MSSEQLFEELKSASEAAHSTVTLLVDVDSTLLHVHTRNLAAFRSFLLETPEGKSALQAEPALTALEFQPTDWGWVQPVERSGLKMSTQARQAMQLHWESHFFSGRFLDKDIEFKGAVEFLRRLVAETQVQVIYLTARDEERMGDGTRLDFKRRGWPLGDRARLWLKPASDLLDAQFKAEAISQLQTQERGEIYLIDNEPTVLKAAEAHLPTSRLIWMNSVHSGVTPINKAWRVLTRWN